MKDVLFTWAKGKHKWHTIKKGNRLFFFEYSERELEGVKSNYWRKTILSKYYHPNQNLFFPNEDIFNTMFEWEKQFDILIIKQDGTMTSNQNDSLK